jgi:Protein of unknown function DUF45
VKSHWRRCDLQIRRLLGSSLFKSFVTENRPQLEIEMVATGEHWYGNRDLIRASILSIDYVIIHELAHAIEPDHGVGWQALMKRLLPDWKERKTELETRLL